MTTTDSTMVYSRNNHLWSGMTLDDAKNAVNNKTYRSDKAKNKAMDKAIIRFQKADENNDGVLSTDEIKKYDRKQLAKTILIGIGGVATAVGIGYLATKGIKMNNALKATTKELADTKTVLAQTDDVLKQTDDALNALRAQTGYGQGTIKAGDEILENAFEAQTKGGNATFTLAEGNEVFPNLWDSNGGNYAPKRGNIIMEYGPQPKEYISNPNLLKEMNAKGLDSYVDRAVSAEPDLMYRTYVGQDGRNFELNPLQFGETVPAQKKIFPQGVALDEPGKSVITLEAAKGSADAPILGVGQFVQRDANGNPYVKDVQDAIKRLDPKDEASKTLFAKFKDFIAKRKEINASGMSDNAKTSAIARAWEKVLEDVKHLA